MAYSFVEENVGWSQKAPFTGQKDMKQEQSQQDTPLNSVSSEEAPALKEGVDQSARPEKGQRQMQRCANCDIDFFWSPTIVQGNVYCCTGCAGGGPCTCDYSLYRSVIIMGVVHYEQ